MRSNKSKEVELYEILFLLDPKLQEKEVSDTIESYQEFLINQGSSVMVQNQGRRKLSFPIKKVQAANFIQFVFLGIEQHGIVLVCHSHCLLLFVMQSKTES